MCSTTKRRWLYQAAEYRTAVALGSLDAPSRLAVSLRESVAAVRVAKWGYSAVAASSSTEFTFGLALPQSREGACPNYSECMFKGATGGVVDERLQAFPRSRGAPSWFTVTMGPKGS